MDEKLEHIQVYKDYMNITSEYFET